MTAMRRETIADSDLSLLRRGELPKGHKRIRVGKWIARNWRYREYLASRKALKGGRRR